MSGPPFRWAEARRRTALTGPGRPDANLSVGGSHGKDHGSSIGHRLPPFSEKVGPSQIGIAMVNRDSRPGSGDYGGPMAKQPLKEIVVGLIADPGLPLSSGARLKESLPEQLSRELSNQVTWTVELAEFSLPLDEQGEVKLNVNARRLREDRAWDYLVYMTDLPKYENDEPLIFSVNTGYGCAVIVLPALGLVRKKRLRRALLQVIAALHGVGDPYIRASDGSAPPASTLSVERRIEADDVNDDAFETVKDIRGRVLLLVGMVRSNRPWRVVPRLSSAMAAALATGAFGVFYTSIWSMADYLPPQRLAIISLLSVLVMGSWLVLHNKLWERPTGSHYREKHVMYNLATVITILSATVLMYLALFAVLLAGSLIIIDAQFLSLQLGHEVGINEYVNLSWLAASLGTMAGAVGSSLDDEESVRRATFSSREYERRQITLEGGRKSAD